MISKLLLSKRNLYRYNAAAETYSFASHQYRVADMATAPKRNIEEGFDYDGRKGLALFPPFHFYSPSWRYCSFVVVSRRQTHARFTTLASTACVGD